MVLSEFRNAITYSIAVCISVNVYYSFLSLLLASGFLLVCLYLVFLQSHVALLSAFGLPAFSTADTSRLLQLANRDRSSALG